MKKYRASSITSILFLIIIFTVSMGTTYKTAKIHLDDLRRNALSLDIEGDSSEEALFIASEVDVSFQSPTSKVSFISSVKDPIKRLQKRIDAIDKSFSENVLFRSRFVNLNGGFSRLLNKKIMDDADSGSTIYRLNNDSISFHYDFRDQSDNIAKMMLLRDFLQTKDTELLFVQAPFKINKYEDALPYGIEDETNPVADVFLKGLSDANIDSLDIRERIYEQGLDFDALFYRTDHHWKISTAFFAHAETMEFLRHNYGYRYNERHTQEGSFETLHSEYPWLGAQGRRVGRLYGGTDGFSAMVPSFDTAYTVTVYENDESIQKSIDGNFFEAIMVKDLFTNRNIRTNRYASYFGLDYPKVEVINHNVQSGKILILQDSFGLPYSGFMSLHFHETQILDLRHFTKTSLLDYLSEESFDFVTFLYNPSFLRNRGVFQFE